jgi:hypothetical protein
MIISEMQVKLTAVTSGFAKAMDRASDKMKKWRKGARMVGVSMGKIGGALKGMASMAVKAGAALAGIAWGAKKIFDLGASIEETGSKYATVFGPEASAEVSAFLDNFANKAGLTTTEAKGLVATTGAIAQGLGFTQKASGAFAMEITKLAGDLSSFNNLPTEEVLMGINSALTGEREQMKRLGVVILEADVQSKAFAMTGKTVAKALTQQEKATATLALITEKAGVAVGDLNRTQGSAANVAKRLTANFKEIRDAVSTALMPAFLDILTSLENNEQKFIEFKAKILENSGLISAWALVFVESVKLIGTFIVGVIANIANMGQIFGNVVEMAKKAATLDWTGVGEAWEKLKENREQMRQQDEKAGAAAKRLGDAIRVAFSGGLIVVRDFAAAVDKLPPVLDEVGNGVAKMAVGLEANMKTVGESISKNLVGRMTDAAQGSKDAFSGFFAYMQKQLVALAMKALLFKAIMGIGTKLGIDTGGFATAMTGFSPATGGGDTGTGAPGAGTPILSGRAANASPRGVIVNQNINFSVSAIDGRSAARFIKEQGGTIAEVIATAAKDSTAYRRQLQGA